MQVKEKNEPLYQNDKQLACKPLVSPQHSTEVRAHPSSTHQKHQDISHLLNSICSAAKLQSCRLQQQMQLAIPPPTNRRRLTSHSTIKAKARGQLGGCAQSTSPSRKNSHSGHCDWQVLLAAAASAAKHPNLEAGTNLPHMLDGANL
jgi:hypothetical protein